MAMHHLSPGEVTNLLPLGDKLEKTATTAFFKDRYLEVIRMVLPAGKQMPAHAVDGPITIQCIEGEVTLRTASMQRFLRSGDLLYLAAGEPHELFATKDSSLLLTIVLLNSLDMSGSVTERRKQHDDNVKPSGSNNH